MSSTQHPSSMAQPQPRRNALRRLVVIAAAATLPVMMLPPATAQAPVTINIVDVAGDLALTQAAFELYASKHPDKVAKFTFSKATAPEMPPNTLGLPCDDTVIRATPVTTTASPRSCATTSDVSMDW